MVEKGKAKGQKTLDGFLKGGNKKAKEELNSDNENDSILIEEDAPLAKNADSFNLPPLHDVPSIFADLVSRCPKIKDVATRLEGRKLRVATMCSGTESPLLALELIQQSIFDQHKVKLDVEHVFSCEIEPFKQAYIERNFHPPLLFRDVCELGDDKAYVTRVFAFQCY